MLYASPTSSLRTQEGPAKQPHPARLGREDPLPFSTGGSNLQAHWRRPCLPSPAQLMCFQFENHGPRPSPPPPGALARNGPLLRTPKPPADPECLPTSLPLSRVCLCIGNLRDPGLGGGINLRNWGPTELR